MNWMAFRVIALMMTIMLVAACGGGGSSNNTGSGLSGPVPTPTSVGTPTGAPSSAVIGAAGGTVSSPDSRITISIPAGALASSTTITIQPITNTAHGGIGLGYELLPDGLSFQKPISLAFTYTAAEVEGIAPEFLVVAFQTADGYWQLVPAGQSSVNATTKTVTASITHFSRWSLNGAARLSPAKKTVRTGDSAVFDLEICYDIVSDDKWLTGAAAVLGSDCKRADRDWLVVTVKSASDWAVNDIAGGNGTIGTLQPREDYGVYTAPATKPNPDTVTVSVIWKNFRYIKVPAVTLTASVTIVDEYYYYGKITFNGTIVEAGSTITYAGDAWVDFRMMQDIDTSTMYEVSPGPATTVRFTQWDYVDSTKTCSLVADAITPFQFTGWLTILKNMPSYSFVGALQVQGTHSCTYTATQEVKTELVGPLAKLLSSSGPSDPGLLPLGSAAPDVFGKADFVDIGAMQHSEWFFVRMP